MLYTKFRIHYPEGTTEFAPEEPQNTLLQGVINCGIIPLEVVIDYEADNSGEFSEVPSEIRQQAWDYWQSQM